MKSVIIALFLSVLAGQSVSAADSTLVAPAKPVETQSFASLIKHQANGFAFWIYDSGAGKAGIKHAWLIDKISFAKFPNLQMLIIIAPAGPPYLVHNFQLSWSRDFPLGFSKVTLGRTGVPMTREVPGIRIDQVETVFYSGFLNWLIARDDGIQFDGSFSRLSWSSAAFAGERRAGGFVDERENGHLHFYQRARVGLPLNIVAGASYRWSPQDRHLLALELSRQFKTASFVFESLTHPNIYAPGEKNITEWYLLAAGGLNKRLRLVCRFQRLVSGDFLIPGLRLFLAGENCELKINGSFAFAAKNIPGQPKAAHKALAQLVLRF